MGSSARLAQGLLFPIGMERFFNRSRKRAPSADSPDIESLAAPEDTGPDAVDLLGGMVSALDGVAQTVREAAIAFHWLDRANDVFPIEREERMLACSICEEVPGD